MVGYVIPHLTANGPMLHLTSKGLNLGCFFVKILSLFVKGAMFVHCAAKLRDKCRCCICKEYLTATLEINFELLLVVFSSNF